ncbi:protein phosphatase 1E-like isoform X4 [Pomacea canaliculata]|uniref:protein phosphatase 1E-like isoform X4 n=1 Tax=Pomacea canaliculata TaxID=400727 RepID=UPI000D726E45|nr:protein phosphatase 1E-like isoform X4 [Pomacea canaliculata]
MDDPSQNEISVFKRFLERFCHEVEEPTSEGNDSPIRHISYSLVPAEIEGESLQWALDYLCQTHGCPHGLAVYIARAAYHRIRELDYQCFCDDSQLEDGPSEIDLRKLQREVTVQVYAICTEWNHRLPSFVHPMPYLRPACSHAIKNTRRKMEDRHVILSDLNTFFELQDSPSQSYYAVFDGHGGPEAAMYATSHLHINMVRDRSFRSDPELAMRRAYSLTDRMFLEKAERQKLRSGTTGVTVFVRGDRCYIGWLGDSQVLLVRDGQPVTVMEPHKPEREDEKKRIEELGGSVTYTQGNWRVNGNISVSRAIGDPSHKPFLCSNADTVSFQQTGQEDYMVLGCDGIWDVLKPTEIPQLVHNYLQQEPGNHLGVAQHLVAQAKESGSSDNISVVVFFFRKDIAKPTSKQQEASQILRENGERNGDARINRGISSAATSASTSRITFNSTTSAKEKTDRARESTEWHVSPGSHFLLGFFCRLWRWTGFLMPVLRDLWSYMFDLLVPCSSEGRVGSQEDLANYRQEADGFMNPGLDDQWNISAVSAGKKALSTKEKTLTQNNRSKASGHKPEHCLNQGTPDNCASGLDLNSVLVSSGDAPSPTNIDCVHSVKLSVTDCEITKSLPFSDPDSNQHNLVVPKKSGILHKSLPWLASLGLIAAWCSTGNSPALTSSTSLQLFGQDISHFWPSTKSKQTSSSNGSFSTIAFSSSP